MTSSVQTLNEDADEKSLRVLEILSREKTLSQRQVALKAGLSVGMVNLILKRLMRTGYIKVSSLDRKKMEYILTPKGIAERMSRSYQYFLRAYRTFFESQSRIESLISPLLESGHRKFVIVGDGEIANLVEMILRNRRENGMEIRRISEGNGFMPEETVLDCRFGQNGGYVGVSVLERILNPTSGPSVGLSIIP